MMGRGTRLHPPTNKLMFRVYDYTNASRLLGREFVARPTPSREPTKPREEEKEKVIRVEGFDVHINPAGAYIVTQREGKLSMVTVEEYREMLATSLAQEVRTLDDFRSIWIDPAERKELIDKLPDDGRGVRLLREIMQWQEYDLYDVLTQIGYGTAPKTRKERVAALQYKHADWFQSLPPRSGKTLFALAKQFIKGGTEELENPYVLNTPEVRKAGGLQALKVLGEPKDVIHETKKRLFAV
jgi:type I restriction enzyme R subunit